MLLQGAQLQRVLEENAGEVRLYCYAEARAGKEPCAASSKDSNASPLPSDAPLSAVRKATLAAPPQQVIYEVPGINASPGGIQKTLV